MSVGQRLRKARKARKMSQDMLAEKIGASRGLITNIELNKISKPQPMAVNAICSVLGISREWLLEGTEPMYSQKEPSPDDHVLVEIYEHAQKLSEEEQLFILDMIKAYTRHMKE